MVMTIQTVTLEEMHEQMDKQYQRGYEDGLRAFAHWKDGVEMVGTSSERPLKQVLQNIKETWNYSPPGWLK
jgi:hypothetical protein